MDHAITLRDVVHLLAAFGIWYFLIAPVLAFFYLWYALNGGPVWFQKLNTWRSNRGVKSPITTLNLKG